MNLLTSAIRTDPEYGQLLAAVSCIAAAIALIWNHFRSHDPANLYVNQQKQ